ncbi:hypothetical protein ALC53_02917 [Atta colombica]|uniref:Uncharacterized protein n=1 Tax=Atta colombica TaxID=520822 RepID=A0A195BR47_9HYME|nr:hypothetical protein ALC53_02917 [Atta colombica]
MYFLGTPTFTRDNHRHCFLTMSFMERNVALDKAHPSSRGTLHLAVLEKSDGTSSFLLPRQRNKL